MRVVFMGTPEFAVPSLRALAGAGYELILVVTQPDRPRGRGRREAPSPVKVAASQLGLPVSQPLTVKEPEFVEFLRSLSPEVIVVVAFGQILPPSILEVPPRGCINVHASLLPKYRGGAPIHWALINGEEKTGVTTMYMDEGLDTGDIILQEEVSIGEEENVGALHDRLAERGAALLVETLHLISAGTAPRRAQVGEPSYAPLLKAEDELIDWQKPSKEIYNHVRGMDPWPGARTFWRGKVLKVWRISHTGEGNTAVPGTVLFAGEEGICVACGKGTVIIKELQLESGKRLSSADFLRGHRVSVGEIFGQNGMGGTRR